MIMAIMKFIVFIITTIVYVVLGKTYRLEVDLAAVFFASVAVSAGFFLIFKFSGA